jgi:NADPH:quinone reductase
MYAMIPDGSSSVRIGEVDEPVPGPDEVLVAVEAYSVNRGETFLLDRPRSGWRPGKDVAGTILGSARDGSGPEPGARVVGFAEGGGWAERVAVPAARVAALPDGVDAVTAAALPLAGLTALRLVRVAGPLIGRRLLVTGASGGVGHYVTEMAFAAGAEVTAVASTVERGARLRELGATTLTDLKDAAGWFDLAMESVGGAVFSAARRRVRPDGRVLWFGQAGLEPITVDFFEWIDDTVGAAIIPVDHAHSDRTDGEDLATLVRLVATGRLHPEVGCVEPWTQTARVVDDLRERRVRGNAVLRVMTHR